MGLKVMCALHYAYSEAISVGADLLVPLTMLLSLHTVMVSGQGRD